MSKKGSEKCRNTVKGIYSNKFLKVVIPSIIILNALLLNATLYTGIKSLIFKAINDGNIDLPLSENESVSETIYDELKVWSPNFLDEIGQTRFEMFGSVQYQQIRNEKASCIISEQELQSKFPRVEPVCRNEKISKSSYGDKSQGFTFSKRYGRKINAITDQYSHDNYKFDYPLQVNTADLTNMTNAIDTLRNKNWIDAQTKGLLGVYSTVAMCVLSVLDLQDKILYATRMEKLRSKLRNKFIQKIYEAEEKYNSEEEARHTGY